MMSTATHKQDEVSFEEAMERLEEIVSSMEGERLPLEEMVQSYEEGAKLLRVCRERIEVARLRVELITANLDGSPKASLTPFDPASDEAADPSPSTTETAPKQRPASQAPSRRKPNTDDDEDIRLF
ncbi:MAG: exodeoxyribonuclease small subunit [Verrucomicrobiaceae bacterium]|nr:exodeoxyribonuclease small subunit [Verrucomicrobiaceae bacterium]